MADEAEKGFAVCHGLDVRITLDMYFSTDGFYLPETTVDPKKCDDDAPGGWAGKTAPGGKKETKTAYAVPFWTRRPFLVPLVPSF